jgi:hypothetical protein
LKGGGVDTTSGIIAMVTASWIGIMLSTNPDIS